jgi:hypothetical protein
MESEAPQWELSKIRIIDIKIFVQNFSGFFEAEQPEGLNFHNRG